MFVVFNRWLERYFADEEAVLVAVILVASLVIILTMGVVLAPMISAVIIAFLMQGVVSRLKGWGVSHLLAVFIAFILLVTGIVMTLVFVLPALWLSLIHI